MLAVTTKYGMLPISWCPYKEITWYKQDYMCTVLVHAFSVLQEYYKFQSFAILHNLDTLHFLEKFVFKPLYSPPFRGAMQNPLETSLSRGDVHYSYEISFHALRNITFHCRSGHIIQLLGFWTLTPIPIRHRCWQTWFLCRFGHSIQFLAKKWKLTTNPIPIRG